MCRVSHVTSSCYQQPSESDSELATADCDNLKTDGIVDLREINLKGRCCGGSPVNDMGVPKVMQSHPDLNVHNAQ